MDKNECGVCYNVYDTFKNFIYLNCFHKVCLDCYNRIKTDNYVQYPFCRKKFDIDNIIVKSVEYETITILRNTRANPQLSSQSYTNEFELLEKLRKDKNFRRREIREKDKEKSNIYGKKSIPVKEKDYHKSNHHIDDNDLQFEIDQ